MSKIEKIIAQKLISSAFLYPALWYVQSIGGGEFPPTTGAVKMHSSISSLTFGAEYEVVSPVSREVAARRVSEISGIPVYSGVGQCPAGSWKIVGDGSIQLRGMGVAGLEFVSPVLSGQAGLDQVTRVVNAIKQIGCKVNSSTGHHVHVGRPTTRIDFFKDLLKLYGRFETAIDSFMPSSRRGNSAYYCRSVANVRREVLNSAQTLAELQRAQISASGAGGAKYHKVNIAPAGKPTVEFRHHAGTVEAVKSVNWIVTCLRMVALANEGKIGEGTAQMVAWDLARLVGKQAHCAQLIARPEGATNEEIRLAFGYRTISARKQLKDAGLPFREVKDAATGKVRFHAVATPASEGEAVGYPATVEGFADLIEATPEQRAYFRGRVAAVRNI
jgi:hypothetical protein